MLIVPSYEALNKQFQLVQVSTKKKRALDLMANADLLKILSKVEFTGLDESQTVSVSTKVKARIPLSCFKNNY